MCTLRKSETIQIQYQRVVYSVPQKKMRNNTNPISNLVDEGVARQTGKPLAIGGKGGKRGKRTLRKIRYYEEFEK